MKKGSKSNWQLWVSRVALVLAILAAGLLLYGLVSGEGYPVVALLLWAGITVLVVALVLLEKPMPEEFLSLGEGTS